MKQRLDLGKLSAEHDQGKFNQNKKWILVGALVGAALPLAIFAFLWWRAYPPKVLISAAIILAALAIIGRIAVVFLRFRNESAAVLIKRVLLFLGGLAVGGVIIYLGR